MTTKKGNNPMKILTPCELRALRQSSAEFAAENLTAQEVHQIMRENGAIPIPNPFYKEKKTEEECFELLNKKGTI